MSRHESFMLEAIELSKQGFPAPNPRVGCVIVNDDQVVGRGFCKLDGGDHAEVMALKEAGVMANGATAYVTLEPCNHFGKTPPCSQSLLRSGVKRVFFATSDPNPIAAGGREFLLSNGIQVEHGILAIEAAKVNAQFLFAMKHRRPFVTVKAGITLDGMVALPSGESKWITNEASRQDAMRLRADIGCVMVGRITAEQDRARLNLRGIEGANQPLRVVLDPRSILSSDLPIFDESAPTLHLTNEQQIRTPSDVLERIWVTGRTGVLIEGGPTTNSRFFESGLVDRIILYVAPKIFGDGKSWVGTLGFSEMKDFPEFELANVENIEGDLKISYQSRNFSKYLESYNL